MSNRKEAINLIARQICIMNGQIWNKLSQKLQDRYITHAGNMIATVERKQAKFTWDHPEPFNFGDNPEPLSSLLARNQSNGRI